MPMFWDHADTGTYLSWLAADGFAVQWSRFIPEGTGGHGLVLARKLTKGDLESCGDKRPGT